MSVSPQRVYQLTMCSDTSKYDFTGTNAFTFKSVFHYPEKELQFWSKYLLNTWGRQITRPINGIATIENNRF
jgi:hypothetical protein